MAVAVGMDVGATAAADSTGGKVRYGEHVIAYRLAFTRRKALEIAVLPDCAVVVKAPLATAVAAVEERIRKRARWIVKQQRFFSQFIPYTPPRRYIGGETHLYLGRQYRLRTVAVERGAAERVEISGGYIYVFCRQPQQPAAVKRRLLAWYHAQAREVFEQVFTECWQRFNERESAKPRLAVRRLQKRWGSLSPAGRMTLNSELIQAPRSCIEYVVMHELCHTRHPHHGRAYYELLQSKVPQWQRLKQRLELCLR